MSEHDQVQIFTGYSDPISQYLDSSDKPGVLVSWVWSGTAGVTQCKLQYAQAYNSEYTLITTVAFPVDRYIHTQGQPSYYYQIIETDDSGNVLFTQKPVFGDELLLNASLYVEVQRFMEKEVFDEQPIWDRGRKSCRWAYKNWNTNPRPQLRIPGPSGDGDNDPFIILDPYDPTYMTLDSGGNNYASGLVYSLDYKGRAFFYDTDNNPVAIQPYDDIRADYSVQLLTTSDLNQALMQAVHTISLQPGAPKFIVPSQAPPEFDAAIITGATYYLLRRLLNGMAEREFRLLLQDPERDSYDAVDLLRKQIEVYEKQWQLDLKAAPIWRYPRMRAIVTPENVLPGGRSKFFRSIWKGMA